MVTPEGLPVVDAMCRALEDGGFGTVDALKRGLAATPGSGAMLRGQRRADVVQTKERPAAGVQLGFLTD